MCSSDLRRVGAPPSLSSAILGRLWAAAVTGSTLSTAFEPERKGAETSDERDYSALSNIIKRNGDSNIDCFMNG